MKKKHLSQSSRDLVVVGSVALDSVKTPFGEVERSLGGSGVYFSCAARFFCPVHLVGVVGHDFPQQHIQLLKKLGIQIDGLLVEQGKTFHWKGYYEKDLNRAITLKTELNVFEKFKPVLMKQHLHAPHLFLANIHPDLQWSVLQQSRKPKWTACDTMNFWIESAPASLDRVLRNVDIVLMNDGEIRQWSGESHLLKAVRKLMKLGPKIVIVKRGEYGAACFTNNGHFAVPAYLLDDVRDPTGAGDSFAGGFLGYLARCDKPKPKDVREAVLHGSVVASFNVQSFSVNRLASLRPSEIQKRLRDYRKMLSI
jgi:sugar/nucleoside kinase (ribokinase family)